MHSFVFHKDTTLFERRGYKLTTMVVSEFSTHYALFWPRYFGDVPLTPPFPSFDGRPVLYPSLEDLRAYVAWRQSDCKFLLARCVAWQKRAF